MSDDQIQSIESAAEDTELVHVGMGDIHPRVVTLTIDRPDARNALNAQVRSELKLLLKSIEQSDMRAVVLTGSDDAKAFVAGADVTELKKRGMVEQREISKRPRVYEVIDDLRQPVIARLNGHTLGGGCEIAMACDFRIAHAQAKLGQPEISLGIIPGGGGTQRLPRLVGEGQAMRLILSGEIIEADEAHDIGLVDEVHEDETFDERVTELASMIASKSPLALEYAKEAVKAASRMDLESGIEYEAELFAQLFATDDKNEGIEAFLNDRDPEWSGK